MWKKTVFMTDSRILCSLFLFVSFLLGPCGEACARNDADSLIAQGWAALVRDNDVEAMGLFGRAYETAFNSNDRLMQAEALLYLGICSYGSNLSKGMDYCMRSMDMYRKMEDAQRQASLTGQAKCLQLIATIYARQGRFRQAVNLSTEALGKLQQPLRGRDITYPGLIYHTLGVLYGRLSMPDSSVYFLKRSVEERVRTNDTVYLPSAYSSVAELEMKRRNADLSRAYFEKALSIAEKSKNRQAQVTALCGMAKWQTVFNAGTETERLLLQASAIAEDLLDKSFYLRVTRQLIDYYRSKDDHKQAGRWQESYLAMKDSVNAWENRHMAEQLKVEFEVGEMDKRLQLARKEKKVAELTNWVLYTVLAVVLIAGAVVVYLLKRVNQRDRQLLEAKGSLMKALEEKRLSEEQHMRSEIEYRESQLSALTLHMAQKNELLREMSEKISSGARVDDSLTKLINRGLVQEKEWADFNTHFESVNKNFYSRLKQHYPGISTNDLRLCALIKLNLSIKEMAVILNISPDSVKTARYRLRKKLNINTEDNLAEFIQSLV